MIDEGSDTDLGQRHAAYAVGDPVTVTGHFTWAGRDTHGHTGYVSHIQQHNEPGWPVIHSVTIDGFPSPAPLTIDELKPATGPGDSPSTV